MEEETPQRETTAAGEEEPSSPAPASSSQQQDSMWLENLSEPELDLLIGLKELATTMATTAGHSKLAVKEIHLRTLRALGTVLMETWEQGLEENSANPNIVDRLALSTSVVHFPSSGSDPNFEINEEDRPTPILIGVNGKQNKMQDD